MTKNVGINQFEKPLIIAGPCSAESETQMLEIAEKLDKNYVQVFRAGIWKPRTKPNSFEGVGAIGLKWLKKVKEEFGFIIATEVATANHVKLAVEHDVDWLWIGARSTANPFTVQEIAEALKNTDKTVLVKNPVNPDLELWIGAIERLQSQSVQKIGAVHRGFSTYKKTKYRNNPQWQIALDFMDKMPGIPMVCDPSHICGNREGIFDVAQQAFNFEYNGLMIETHNNPDQAWSDAKQQITPENLLEILKKLELRKSNDEDTFYHSQLNLLRNEIDETDQSILEMLAQRMAVSLKIGELKKEHNVAIYQPERWKTIRENAIEQGKKLGLSDEFIDKLIKSVHQESILHQNQIMNNENPLKP